MAVFLERNSYGKHAVNLSKVIRHADHHEFRQLSVSTRLQGDFDSVYLQGDNSSVLATDTQKNIIYALAKDHFTSSVEAFGLYLADHFMQHYPQLSQVNIDIDEHGWKRMQFGDDVHRHAYISEGNEKHSTSIVQQAGGVQVWSGVRDMLILKTTDSAFEGFLRDRYTTLKETSDRILSTSCEATWRWAATDLDFAAAYAQVKDTMLHAFAHHKSLSVQQTLYAMAEAVLEKHPAVEEISLIMPNKHHIPFNLEPFGMENSNEIFVATDEPYGYITGTVKRS